VQIPCRFFSQVIDFVYPCRTRIDSIRSISCLFIIIYNIIVILSEVEESRRSPTHPHRPNLSPQEVRRSLSHPPQTTVIPTEAADSLIVRRAVEGPPNFAFVFALARSCPCFCLCLSPCSSVQPPCPLCSFVACSCQGCHRKNKSQHLYSKPLIAKTNLAHLPHPTCYNRTIDKKQARPSRRAFAINHRDNTWGI
jgi:hypothetical protein